MNLQARAMRRHGGWRRFVVREPRVVPHHLAVSDNLDAWVGSRTGRCLPSLPALVLEVVHGLPEDGDGEETVLAVF